MLFPAPNSFIPLQLSLIFTELFLHLNLHAQTLSHPFTFSECSYGILITALCWHQCEMYEGTGTHLLKDIKKCTQTLQMFEMQTSIKN